MKHLCPICRKSTDSNTDADFPFCSERCRLIDLGNWAAERYVVSEPVFEEDEIEGGKFDLRLTDDTLNDDAPNPDPESDGESKSDATVDSDTRFDSNSGFDLGRDTSAHRPSGKHDSDG